MNASDWIEVKASGYYTRDAHRLRGIVRLDGLIWRSEVYVDDNMVDCGEWDGRSHAIANANAAMGRAMWIRKFEKDPPLVSDYDDDDCGDPDEDE